MTKTEHSLPEIIKDVVTVIAGILFCGFALKGFLVPNKFFDGGVTGISLLIHELYHINIAFVIIAANIPFVILGAYQVNRVFALKTFVCVIALGVCLLYVPYPVITSDKLLVSIFGGVFMGLGVGLSIRGGCALDGIEIMALYTLKRSSFTISEIILGINIIIFTIAGFKYGLETALYSILTYFTATRCIDYVVEGLQAYTGVTIVSGKSEAIKYQLVNKLGRGITVYKGERGYLPGSFDIRTDCEIITTIVTRLEIKQIQDALITIDPAAFVYIQSIKEATGGVLKEKAHAK